MFTECALEIKRSDFVSYSVREPVALRVFIVKFVYFYFVAFFAYAIVGFVLFFRKLSATL